MRLKGRVVKLDRGLPLVETAEGLMRCKHSTAIVKDRERRAVIGDLIVIDKPDDADTAQIAEILPRRNALVRKDPAERALPQVLAANFDLVAVAHSAAELNLRRLDRELVLAHEGGVRVLVVLTKADLVADDARLGETLALVRSIAAEGVDVLAVSELDPASIDDLRRHLPADGVSVLVGRSGVGKSSLVNLLAGGRVAATQPVRETDGKGRHTTVSREMVRMEGGGLIVDMPGVRGVGMWESEAGIEAAFPDVARLAAECRFRDCRHENEPGCAVLAAVEAGEMPLERLESYRRLREENEEQSRRNEEARRQSGRGGPPPRRPRAGRRKR